MPAFFGPLRIGFTALTARVDSFAPSIVTFVNRPLTPPLGLALLALALFSASGCVQRRFTIRTNPPGAQVYVDDEYVGVTPVSFDYTYYGTRQFRLVRDGYETLTVRQAIPTPWYEYFPLDFVSENLIPYEIRDERAVEYQLQPQRIVPRDELLQRAEELRRSGVPPVPGGLVPPPGAVDPRVQPLPQPPRY
ncbi:MAG: PEGA domain-containing protein [Pirellulales bacterium]|nr:PEGA domain-containing protein [Pirellulales bacterium]